MYLNVTLRLKLELSAKMVRLRGVLIHSLEDVFTGFVPIDAFNACRPSLNVDFEENPQVFMYSVCLLACNCYVLLYSSRSIS